VTVQTIQGDCSDVLKTLPDESVHCCITSPPYWGLRDYQVDGQLGLERTPEEYVAKMVEIFREARRVLRDDGVLFLNLGDSYAGSGAGGGGNRKGNEHGQHDAMAKIGRPVIQNGPSCDTSGKVPEDCPLHDSIWSRPCDGCRAVSILRTFHNGQRPSDGGDPNREHTESVSAHSPKSRSFPPKQTRQSFDAIQDLRRSEAPGDEPLLSSSASMPVESLRQSPGECWPKDNFSSSPNGEGEKIPDGLPSDDKTACNGGTIQTSFSSAGRIGDKVRNVCPYLDYTTAFHNVKLKPKDLVGIPWRVAFALQADGWWLRSDIIWAKPNPMPESVTDRCTRSHEYIFMLAKSQHYYYDAEAIKEPCVNGEYFHGDYSPPSADGPGRMSARNGRDKQRGHSRRHAGFNERWDKMERDEQCSGMRNKRDVWTVSPAQYADAHFATFPPELIIPCVMAGCPQGGTVLDPFAGSGTTGEVAEQHGRNSILIELNPKYVEMIKARTAQAGLFAT